MTGNKCYIYSRVSTKEQSNDVNGSFDTQLKVCTNYALTNNLAIKGVYNETCSARNVDNQKELKKLFTFIKRNYNEQIYILVSDTTRFSRDLIGCAKLFESFKDCDIIIISINDYVFYHVNNKLEHTNSQFLDKLLDSKKEGDRISQRAKLSYAKRKANGYTINIPYGKLRKVTPTGKYRLFNNQNEQKIIKKVIKLTTSGFSRPQIVKYLTDNNLTHRNGKPFTVSRISTIIKNYKVLQLKDTTTSIELMTSMEV